MSPFPIDKFAFQYGCVAPDFFIKMPGHTMEESLSYIALLIKEVQQFDLHAASLEMKRDWFIKLGVITHYVSDYFCWAHNDVQCYQNFFSHIRYENRLHGRSIGADLVQISHTAMQRYDYCLYMNPTALLEYMKDAHLSYLAEEPHLGNDISYAVQTSTNVIAAALYCCIFNIKQNAA